MVKYFPNTTSRIEQILINDYNSYIKKNVTYY